MFVSESRDRASRRRRRITQRKREGWRDRENPQKKHESQRLRLPKRKAPALTVAQQGTIAFSASNAETGQLLQALD